MALELDKCCYCVPLRTGSLIIGYVWLVINIILGLISILAVVTAAQRSLYTALTVFSIVLFFVVLNTIFTVILLIGTHKNIRRFVLSYLIYNSIFILLYTTLMIYAIVVDGPRADNIIPLIVVLSGLYFLVVLRSFYLKMEDPALRPTEYNTVRYS